MAADHSARGSMKTGVKPETVCELQDTNDHRQVERKWRLPISVGELSTLEGRLTNLRTNTVLQPWTLVIVRCTAPSRVETVASARLNGVVSSAVAIRPAPNGNARAVSNALILIRADAPFVHTQSALFSHSTSGVLDHALNLSISLSAGKETKWDSPSNGE